MDSVVRSVKKEQAPLMAGLVITDEPGIYIEGSHGVRTENELLVRKFLRMNTDSSYTSSLSHMFRSIWMQSFQRL